MIKFEDHGSFWACLKRVKNGVPGCFKKDPMATNWEPTQEQVKPFGDSHSRCWLAYELPALFTQILAISSKSIVYFHVLKNLGYTSKSIVYFHVLKNLGYKKGRKKQNNILAVALASPVIGELIVSISTI